MPLNRSNQHAWTRAHRALGEDVPTLDLQAENDALLVQHAVTLADIEHVTDSDPEIPIPMPRTPTATLTIAPSERPVADERMIDVWQIDVPAGTPAPTPEFVANVRAFGILQSIAVRDRGARRYEVVEGARRVLACREIGIGSIHALVYPAQTPRRVIAAMTLSANNLRRSNPLRELEAIERLVEDGADETSISRELHIPRQTLQARMRLSRLVPELRAALGNGRIGAAVADLASRLDVARQNQLVELLDERAMEPREQDRRITATDVRTLRQARQDSHVAELPDALFGGGARDFDVEHVSLGPSFRRIDSTMVEVDGLRYLSVDVVGRDFTDLRTRHSDQLQAVRVEVRTNLEREFSERLRAAEQRAADVARTLAATPSVTVTVPAVETASVETAPVETESWESVHRLLVRALELTPIEPNPRSERLYQSLEELVEAARQTVRPDPVTAYVPPAAPYVPPTVLAPRTNIPNIMIRGQYRMFDREPGNGRHYMRYIDSNGRLRRRFMNESTWNNQLRIAQQRESLVPGGR